MYHHSQDPLVRRKLPSYGRNADGPFYVSDQCITCGLPVETAPENIKWDCSSDCADCPRSCYVAKQPENDEELARMLEALEGSEVENIRYCGTHPQVLQALQQRGLAHLCDAFLTGAYEHDSR